MNTQYKKDVLELCVLSMLHKRDCYGYEINIQFAPNYLTCFLPAYRLLTPFKNANGRIIMTCSRSNKGIRVRPTIFRLCLSRLSGLGVGTLCHAVSEMRILELLEENK